jgi:hypothetical protein
VNGRRLMAVTGVIVVVTGVAWGIAPPWRDTIVSLGVLLAFVAALTEAAVAARKLAGDGTSPFEEALIRHSVGPDRPPDLERFERLLGWRWYSSRDFDHLARPLLRSLLRDRLLARRGVDLDTDAATARALVPHDLWAAVAGSAVPSERDVEWVEVARILDRIEEV